MSKRANALAERIEQGAEALAALAEGLSEAEWQRVVPNEERTIAALVHHVAGACPILVDWARGLADGKPLTGVTWEAIAQMNAQANRRHSNCSEPMASSWLIGSGSSPTRIWTMSRPCVSTGMPRKAPKLLLSCIAWAIAMTI